MSTKEVQNKDNNPQTKSFLEYFIIIGGTTLGLLISLGILLNFNKFTLLHTYVPEKWDFDSKIILLSLIGSCIGGYLLFCVLSCGALRGVLGYYNPVGIVDPPSIDVFNKVLTNTKEQTLIFLPNLIYWTFKNSNENNKDDVLMFGSLFLFGRLLFLAGYFIGTLKGLQTLRLTGFVMTIAASVAVIQRNLGFNYI